MAPADLPPEVLVLARRLGALSNQRPERVCFAQAGKLRTNEKADWMEFTATQWMDCTKVAFAWNAKTGPLKLLRVEDALYDSAAKGQVSFAGLLPLAKATTSDVLIKSQLMRYLAELPWCPDAILSNRDLRWSVQSTDRVEVAASQNDVTGSVEFELDGQGLPARVTGIRPREENGAFAEREWIGHFGDYCDVGGALIAHSARVGWVLEDGYCEVWRGSVTDWQREQVT